jgi:protein-disulfide isomerase
VGTGRKWIYGIVMVALLLAAYFDPFDWAPPQLEFRDLSFPQGFRSLALDGASSRLDPFAGLQRRPEEDGSKPTTQQICEALFRDLVSPATGRPDSPLQIAAFLDYRCPYCRTLADILANIPGDKARIVYKEWPILGEGSVLAARAALAADRQGKYREFHLRLMNSRFVPTVASIEEIAAGMGLDIAQLRSDMASDATTRTLRRTADLASVLGFMGSPAMVVGRTLVQGEISAGQLERLGEEEMSAEAPKPC